MGSAFLVFYRVLFSRFCMRIVCLLKVWKKTPRLSLAT